MKKYIIYESAVSSTPTATLTSKPNIVKFVACLIDCDIKNRNGRVYPKEIIEQALRNPTLQDTLRAKRLYCEMGHPFEQNLQRQTTIDPRNICCVIDDIYWEGNKLMATMETLDTALGHDVAGLIRQGCQIAFSMRAEGRVQELGGYKQVQPGLIIVGWDMVVVPSHEHAHIERIISEQTAMSMFNYNRYANRTVALNESLNIAENGLMIDCDSIKESVDYSAFHLQKYKPASKVYIYNENDEIKQVDGNKLVLESEDKVKTVNTEDYLTKMTREKLVGLRESSMTGIEPVYTPVGTVNVNADLDGKGPDVRTNSENEVNDYGITNSLDSMSRPIVKNDLPSELVGIPDEDAKDIVKEDLEFLLNCSDAEMDIFEQLHSNEYMDFLYESLYDALLTHEYLIETNLLTENRFTNLFTDSGRFRNKAARIAVKAGKQALKQENRAFKSAMREKRKEMKKTLNSDEKDATARAEAMNDEIKHYQNRHDELNINHKQDLRNLKKDLRKNGNFANAETKARGIANRNIAYYENRKKNDSGKNTNSPSSKPTSSSYNMNKLLTKQELIDASKAKQQTGPGTGQRK